MNGDDAMSLDITAFDRPNNSFRAMQLSVNLLSWFSRVMTFKVQLIHCLSQRNILKLIRQTCAIFYLFGLIISKCALVAFVKKKKKAHVCFFINQSVSFGIYSTFQLRSKGPQKHNY